MITIDQDALCDYCEKNHETNRGRCEGNRCDEATSDYIEDHGLMESGENGKQTFGDLGIDDRIFVLDIKDLTFESVRIYGVAKYDESELRFDGKDELLVYAGKSASMRIVDNKKGFFVKKEDMKARYETLMLNEIKRMAATLVQL